MEDASLRWEQIYQQVPLVEVPRHYAGIRQSQFMMQYLTAILERCPRGGRALETGIGSGYSSVWLSLRGVCAEGIDNVPGIVERAAQVNTAIGGKARFRVGDLFSLYSPGASRYDVIYSQGVLEHFTMREIQSALSQGVAMASSVVFSCPSANYPFPAEFGDERLLTLEVWREILEPFDIEEIRYYGDPQHGEKEHILCILRGQEVTDDLLELMKAHEKPLPIGITGLVLARNEERHMAACLGSLQFCDERIVVDMSSEDRTAEIARACNARVVSHPIIHPFDRARNVGATLARFSHVLILDSDERAPPALAEALRHIVETQVDSFEGMNLPFRHHFAGHWMRCLYPGYTAPRLFKNGKFVFNSRLHSGAEVDGRIAVFPADDPGKALEHFSFESVFHYQTKQNSYTDGEAASMFRDGAAFDWRQMLLHSMQDFVSYYDTGAAYRDGPYGLIYSLLSANYRLLQHAKLFELRANAGLLLPQELEVPQSTGDIAAVLLGALQHRPAPQPEPIVIADTEDAAEYVLTGPAFDRSGYAEEFRNAAFALEDAGACLRVQSLPWNDDPDIMTESERERYETMRARPAKPGFTHIIWDFPRGWRRDPNAGRTIVRTMHETDRFPQAWVQASHRVDELWVPTEFNKKTAAGSGIDPGKLRVAPGCFDFDGVLHGDISRRDAEAQRDAHQEDGSKQEPRNKGSKEEARTDASETAEQDDFLSASGSPPSLRRYGSARVFLSVFDWSRHKGWDVLLPAFLRAFGGRPDVRLVLKVWSTNFLTNEAIFEQARQHVMETLGIDLSGDDRVQFVFDRLSRPEVVDLYKSCDCFVLPTRGEGWGRIFTEAMALGVPVIGTNWSGNTAFMTDENSYLIDCSVEDVPEAGWREIPAYKGHRWAEPDAAHLEQLMLRVVECPEEAAAKAALASEQVRERYSRAAVGRVMAEALGDGERGKLWEGETGTPTSPRPSPDRSQARWERGIL